MKAPFTTACVLFGALLGPPAVGVAQDSDRSHPAAFVKNSAITTKITAKLGTERWGRIHVDTDKNGVVWLTGSARTQEAAEEAESIARGTEGVRTVHSAIKIDEDESADATHPSAQHGKPPQAGDRGLEEAVGMSLVLALLSGSGEVPR
jgi:hyperosmotically inducible protein